MKWDQRSLLLFGLLVWGMVVSGMFLIHSLIRDWQERHGHE